MDERKHRPMAVIIAEIMDVGPYLPGTVRSDRRKRTRKDGTEVFYEVQPRLNCLVDGRRRDIRIPKRFRAEAEKLTANYARLQALLRALDGAALYENLPGGASKKNSPGRVRAALPREHRLRARRHEGRDA